MSQSPAGFCTGSDLFESPIGLSNRLLNGVFHSPHHADPSKHGGAAAIGNEYERLDRGLLFGLLGFLFWKPGNVGRRVAECALLFALGEDDRIVEFA